LRRPVESAAVIARPDLRADPSVIADPLRSRSVRLIRASQELEDRLRRLRDGIDRALADSLGL